MKLYRRFVADRAMGPHLVVVSTPSLAFSPRVVEAHEPVGVQALGSELAVERLDEGVVGRLAGPGEVERDAASDTPTDRAPADELGALVDADRLRDSRHSAAPRSSISTTSAPR